MRSKYLTRGRPTVPSSTLFIFEFTVLKDKQPDQTSIQPMTGFVDITFLHL